MGSPQEYKLIYKLSNRATYLIHWFILKRTVTYEFGISWQSWTPLSGRLDHRCPSSGSLYWPSPERVNQKMVQKSSSFSCYSSQFPGTRGVDHPLYFNCHRWLEARAPSSNSSTHSDQNLFWSSTYSKLDMVSGILQIPSNWHIFWNNRHERYCCVGFGLFEFWQQYRWCCLVDVTSIMLAMFCYISELFHLEE